MGRVDETPLSSEKCRAKAQECEAEAARARDEESRRTYQYLAEYWYGMAALTWQSGSRRRSH
ncbi:MAG: hypothetical protein JO128_05685 [Alphaproteobacteria bacterium]|nr:hypothetical protein [Alphaproteobacteria bacterium]